MAFSPTPARADALFRLTEIVVEAEVKPHPGRHVVQWEGDYYVSDAGVSVSGWGEKPSPAPIPFDQPHRGASVAGSPFVSIFHRRPDGLDVTIDYESFVLARHVTQTGPHTCEEAITVSLKPGRVFFEDRRLSNQELMFESRRTYQLKKCEVPPLLS